MWVGVITTISVAMFFFWLAFNISKGRTDLIHDYHTVDIKDEDKMDYAKMLSKGLYSIGIGSLIAGLCICLKVMGFVLPAIFLGFTVGLSRIFKAQKKYSGKWL